jgi:transcriptional regulator with XRE-family HTH domain
VVFLEWNGYIAGTIFREIPMLVQKLRLQRGWSQEQLAELSGLSVRTVQRVEQRHDASVETWKSLASVFEMDFNELRGAPAMTSVPESSSVPDPCAVPQAQSAASPSAPPESVQQSRTREEQLALLHVHKLRRFYKHVMLYFVIIIALTVINALSSPAHWWVQWAALGWGLALVLRANALFQWIPFLGANWEKRVVEKRLGRPL